jgi:hypothetical protein
MTKVETRIDRRNRWFDSAKTHTAKANLARERLAAFNGLVKALQALYCAYEGNEYCEVINALFREVMKQCLIRRPLLKEAIVENDTQAAKFLELLENDNE